ncbi:hypothetical protein [Corynebacterium glutamicum]|uniref:VG15 protein n=1 Tax=Corynebacterium glutamicum TaxID=1718 RepID=UPI001B8B2083|nr:hypothetical protein [Corynebacterium glutamicum]
MTLTLDQATEYRGILTEINRLAQRDLVALWQHFSDRSKDEFFAAMRDGVPEVVALYRAMAADTAGLFFDETQGLGLDLVAQSDVLVPNYEQLERNLRWAYYGAQSTNVLSLVGGIVQKHVINGARDYGITSMGSQTWVRDARPGACTFCRLLATRGMTNPVTGRSTVGFSSAGAASVKAGGDRTRAAKAGRVAQAAGDAFHENCMCIPVLQSEYEPPAHVEGWLDDYNKAYGSVGGASDLSAILSEMRRISGHAH